MNNINYSFKKYVYPERWVSYWHQIDEVLKLTPKNLLIIGSGDAMVSEVLKKYIKQVKTFDIESELEPNIIGSVDDIALPNNSFDVVLCCEVLEHLPFEKFEKCLKEIKRIAKKDVVLSLPHFGPPIKFSFKIPFIKEIKIAFKVPYFIKHKPNEHCWEIGKRGYSSRKIRQVIKKYFRIKKEFIPFENQYHHFYVLEKNV